MAPPVDCVLHACRDGLERIDLPDRSTLAALKQAIHDKMQIPLEDMILSKDPRLVSE